MLPLRVVMTAEQVRELEHVTIIGVGLVGGSIGLALKARNRRVRVAGVGRRRESLQEALKVGAIDTAHLDATQAVPRSDLVILATPVGAFETHLRAIAGVLAKGAVVTDVGSTKAQVVRTAERILGRGGPFVGSHPMAGSERRGVAFARADLLAGATCIVTPTPGTPRRLLRRVENLWRDLGMRTLRMSPAAHDRALARVSHLPHVLSGLLVNLPRDSDLGVAATGFRDMARLAAGDPEMWRDVIMTNRRAILDALDEFDESLMHLRDLIELGDARGIQRFLSAAKKRREHAVAKPVPDPSLRAE